MPSPTTLRPCKQICGWLAAVALTAQAAPAVQTPEQERAALIQALQKRLPGTGPADWTIGGNGLDPGVQAIPLNADNATNSADILAIGKKLWDRKFRDGKSMAYCFPNTGKRVAATYPQFDAKTKVVVTFEMALNRCLSLHGEPVIDPADNATLGPLAAYGRSLSIGQKLTIRVATPAAREKYDAGQRLFQQRLGQQNFACASCHVQHAGAIYGEDKDRGLSAAIGQATSWPRLQPGGTVRTLHMQFQRCMRRAGAEPFAIGSEEFNNLEYYHAYLSNGLAVYPLATVR